MSVEMLWTIIVYQIQQCKIQSFRLPCYHRYTPHQERYHFAINWFVIFLCLPKNRKTKHLKTSDKNDKFGIVDSDDDVDGDSKLGYLFDNMHKIRLRLWIFKQLDEKLSIMVAQYRLRVPENRTCTRRFACKREEVIGWCRTLLNKELRNLHSSDIFEKGWSGKGTRHVEGQMLTYDTVVRKPWRKAHLEYLFAHLILIAQ
jgi:hypothetical protein